MRANPLNKYRIGAFVITLSMLALALNAFAQQPSERVEFVRFPPGLTTTVLRGTLLVRCKPSEENCSYAKKGYSLHARAGQTFTLKLSPSDGSVIINDILGTDGKSIIPIDADQDFWYGWTVKPMKNGDYRIYINTTLTAKRVNDYTLTVSLTGQAAGSESSQDDSFWIGEFEQEDGGGKEVETLLVRRQGGKITAVYRSVVTAQLIEYFSMIVEVNGNTASFYYDKCLPKEGEEDFDGYDPNPCSEGIDKNGRYKNGDLMFTLEKMVDRNKKTKIFTHPDKLNDIGSGVSFKKVK